VLAGQDLTTGSSNIDIGNRGVAGEGNTIRIGTPDIQTAAYISGINGVTVTGVPVLVASNGQLGVQTSSARYKQDIQPMASSSEQLMQLKPVTFRYKQDPDGALQYGLIAEQVAQVYPELVVKDAAGQVQAIRYQELTPMLLNELQKQAQALKQKDEQLGALEQQVKALQIRESQMDALAARMSALEQRAGTAGSTAVAAAGR
jgi:hypothetical protein